MPKTPDLRPGDASSYPTRRGWGGGQPNSAINQGVVFLIVVTVVECVTAQSNAQELHPPPGASNTPRQQQPFVF